VCATGAVSDSPLPRLPSAPAPSAVMDVPGGVAVTHPIGGEPRWVTRTTVGPPLAEIDDVRQPWRERPAVVHGPVGTLFGCSALVGVTACGVTVAMTVGGWLWLDILDHAVLGAGEATPWWVWLCIVMPIVLSAACIAHGASMAAWAYMRVVRTCTTRAYALHGLSSDDAVVRIGAALSHDAALHMVMTCYHEEPRSTLAPAKCTASWTGRQPVVGVSALAADAGDDFDVLLPGRGEPPVRLFLPARAVLTPAARAAVDAQVDAFVAANVHRDTHHVVVVQLVLHAGFCQRLTVYAPGRPPVALGPTAWAVAVAAACTWAFELAARAAMGDRQLTIARTFVVDARGNRVGKGD